jgi:outer membrane protein TolC
MSDAIFAPLAARQAVYAQQSAACVATNDVLLQVSLGYLELLRTAGNLAIAVEAQRDAEELAVLTKNYATTGQGLPSDADRASTEYSIRRENVFVAQEAVRVASARLAEVLRLDPRLNLTPLDPAVVQMKFVKEESPDGELISLALNHRPELAEARFLVGVATERLRREQYAPLLPSVLIGTSYGDFGGGIGGAVDNSGGRLETDAIAFWQLRNLGLGDRAAQAEARSVVRQTQISQMASMDRVAREVVEAHIQLAARGREIPRLSEAVASAIASQKRNMQRIREAQGLPIEVLQSNQALAQARLEYLRALADYDTAQFRLYWAIGWPTN